MRRTIGALASAVILSALLCMPSATAVVLDRDAGFDPPSMSIHPLASIATSGRRRANWTQSRFRMLDHCCWSERRPLEFGVEAGLGWRCPLCGRGPSCIGRSDRWRRPSSWASCCACHRRQRLCSTGIQASTPTMSIHPLASTPTSGRRRARSQREMDAASSRSSFASTNVTRLGGDRAPGCQGRTSRRPPHEHPRPTLLRVALGFPRRKGGRSRLRTRRAIGLQGAGSGRLPEQADPLEDPHACARWLQAESNRLRDRLRTDQGWYS